MKKTLMDIFAYLLGGALVALSISSFAAPNDIAAGGFSGVATLLQYLFGLPIGTVLLIMNIPVFVIGARTFGNKFLYKSLVATVFMSIMIDLSAAFVPVYAGNRLLAALFGGVLSGLGLAIVFIRGATTGGVDIIAKVINLKYSHISIGRLMLMLDALVVIAAAFVYRNIESGLYAVVMIFAQSKTIDSLIYGMEKGKVLLINSAKYDIISDEIMNKLHRGVTFLDAKGAYSKAPSSVILCAVRPYEAAALRNIVKQTDKNAFIMVLEAGEIVGEGFKTL